MEPSRRFLSLVTLLVLLLLGVYAVNATIFEHLDLTRSLHTLPGPGAG